MTDTNVLVPFEFSSNKSLLFPFGKCVWFPNGRFTRADGEDMVNNFKSNILDRVLPVNIEHERSSGRVGAITGVEMGDNGVYGTYEWDKEDDDIQSKWKYISPEVKWDWTHPYSGAKHKNVLMGAAATNYPKLLGKTAIFSEGEWEAQEMLETESDTVSIVKLFTDAINSLIGRLELNTDSREDIMPEINEEKLADGLFARIKDMFTKEQEDIGNVEQETESVAAQLSEMKTELENSFSERLGEKDAEIARMAQEKEDADSQIAEFNDKIVQAETREKMVAFTEQAKEIGAPVEAGKFAEALMCFSDADTTEDKALYNMLIAVLKAKGNAQETGELFGEIGTDATGTQTVDDKFNALVNARVEKGEDIATATENVLNANSDLYTEWNKAHIKTGVSLGETNSGATII